MQFVPLYNFGIFDKQQITNNNVKKEQSNTIFKKS